MQLTRN